MEQKQKSKDIGALKKGAEAGDFPINIISNEPLILGIVLRGIPQDIQKLKIFLETSSLTIVYKTLSYGHLYITSEPGGKHVKD